METQVGVLGGELLMGKEDWKPGGALRGLGRSGLSQGQTWMSVKGGW